MSRIVTLRVEIGSDVYILDTYMDESIQINRRVQDLETISSAQGTITRLPFRVPLNGSAIEAFGDLTDLTSEAKTDLRKKIPGSVLINNYPAFTGSFHVIGAYINPKATLREVELVFEGEETNLKSVLQGIPVSELLDGETIPYTMAEIYSYFNDPTTYIADGYAWPIIDYGQNFTANSSATSGTLIFNDSNNLDQTNFKPAVRVSKILSELEDQEDITITLDSSISDFEDLFYPLHNNGNILPALDTSLRDYTGYLQRTTAKTTNFTSGSGTTEFDFNDAFNFNQIVFDAVNDEYEAQIDGVCTFRMDLNITIDNNSTSGGSPIGITNLFSVLVFINGSPSPGGATVFTLRETIGANSSKDLVASREFQLGLTAGDVVDVRFADTILSAPGSIDYDITENIGNKFSCVATPTYTATSNVDVGANVHEDLTTWDIVREIIVRSNGIVEFDGISTYTITPWVEWIEDNSEIFDITDRIEEGQSIKIEPTSVVGAKRIEFKFEEDDDLYNQRYRDTVGQNYGDLIISDTGTDFTDSTVTIESKFSSTPIANIEDSMPIPKFIDDEGEIVETNPRLLYCDFTERYPTTIYLVDGVTGTTYEAFAIPIFGIWSDQDGGFTENSYNWGQSLSYYTSTGYPNNTLYKRFWEKYITETYGINARKVKMKIRLKSNEISELSFNRPVFWKNSILRLLEIQNASLNSDDAVTCIFAYRTTIENIDIAPFYPFDVIDGIVQWKDSSTNATLSPADGSGETAADVEQSCDAYGFFYDSANNIGIQRGQLLRI